MMRRREKELEDLLAAKTEELTAARREIEKSNTEAQELKRRFEERDAYVQKLQARESDVVAAFAEIQSSRNRKLKETEEEVRQMTENARRIVDRAKLDADRIQAEAAEAANKTRNEALKDADALIQKAKEEAAKIQAEADALHADCEDENRRMKLQLASIAHQCKGYIQTLESHVARLQDVGWTSEENTAKEEGATAEPEKEPAPIEEENAKIETPETYDDPADLMKNIYAIENRDLPFKEEAAAEETPKEDNHVWTVDEIVDSVMDDGKTGEDEYLEKLIEEILQ